MSYTKEQRQAKENQVAEKKVTGECPWCSHEDEGLTVPVEQADKKGVVRSEMVPKESVESKVISIGGDNMQCQTCGKNWKKAQLGKPWTIELERGEAWAREVRARELRGA